MKHLLFSLITLALFSLSYGQATPTSPAEYRPLIDFYEPVYGTIGNPAARQPGNTLSKPTVIKKRLRAVGSTYDSVRYYYSSIRGSNFPTSLLNFEAWYAPLYKPHTEDKYLAYDSAAKWHRNFQWDTVLAKRRTYINNYNSEGQVIRIHNPSHTENEMINAQFSLGEQYSNMDYNSSGLLKQYDYSYDTTWANTPMGYSGMERYKYQGRHNITFDVNGLPETHVFRLNDNGSLVNSHRLSYYYNIDQLWDSVITSRWDTLWLNDTAHIMSWIDSAKSLYTYGANGSFEMEHFTPDQWGNWNKQRKLVEGYDDQGRLVNRETWIYKKNLGVYHSVNKNTRSYEGNFPTFTSDTAFLGYEIYANHGSGGYNGGLFTGPDVWVPYFSNNFYLNAGGAIDSFLEVRNYDVDNTFLYGWLPSRIARMTLNEDDLTTSYKVWYNSSQQINWTLGYSYRYYYEEYDDALPLNLSEYTVNGNDWVVYPNPAANDVTVSWHVQKGPRQLQLIDISGKCWQRILLPAGGGRLDLTTLPQGAYWILLQDHKVDGQQQVRTLIKR